MLDQGQSIHNFRRVRFNEPRREGILFLRMETASYEPNND